MQDITIAGAEFLQVPSIVVPKVGGGQAQFYDMSGDFAWMGKDAECVNDSFYSSEDTLDNTLYNGWTPSTSTKAIVATKTAGAFAADTENYEYYLVWECNADPVYDGTEATKALLVFNRGYIVQQIFKRANSWANVQSETPNSNACVSLFSTNFARYYSSNSSITYTWNSSYGLYFAATAATFSNATSSTPTVTVKTPTLSARCSTTYFSTSNAGKVIQAESGFSIKCKIYRVKPRGVLRGIYDQVVKLVNEAQ